MSSPKPCGSNSLELSDNGIYSPHAYSPQFSFSPKPSSSPEPQKSKYSPSVSGFPYSRQSNCLKSPNSPIKGSSRYSKYKSSKLENTTEIPSKVKSAKKILLSSVFEEEDGTSVEEQEKSQEDRDFELALR